MGFKLAEVVPWGRSFDEYVRIFALDHDDLAKRILGCGDGPASFNCTLTKRGGSVVSIDPLYRFAKEEIARRITETYDVVLNQMTRNQDEFLWTQVRSVEELGLIRMKAMQEFLSDYQEGMSEGRYLDAQLPTLPFPDGAFDLALCSHFLFLYSEQFDSAFHLASLKELCRVAGEVRIFPLLELGSERSRHLDAVVSALRAEGYEARTERVPYEFQRGGNEMLRIEGRMYGQRP